MELIRMGVMALNEAKQFQKECSEKGIELVLNHDDQTCTRGCAITVEIHGQEKDLPVIQKIFSERYAKLLEGHDINIDQMNAVYDPNLENATCPACGTQFSTSSTECPECGLCLG